MNNTPDTQFTDKRGVSYRGDFLSQGIKTDANGKIRNDGLTIRRISPRPVDIKRANRVGFSNGAKRAAERAK